MVELVRIDPGPPPALPCRVEGDAWAVTVDHGPVAWLMRGRRDVIALPLPAATMARDDGDRLWAWLAPDAWLLIGAPTAKERDCPAGWWFDVSARYTALRVTGDTTGFGHALTGLTRASLHPGRSLPTRMAAHAALVIPRPDHLLILVERGRDAFWIEWLCRHRSIPRQAIRQADPAGPRDTPRAPPTGRPLRSHRTAPT